jgi:hypothetical protein
MAQLAANHAGNRGDTHIFQSGRSFLLGAIAQNRDCGYVDINGQGGQISSILLPRNLWIHLHRIARFVSDEFWLRQINIGKLDDE